MRLAGAKGERINSAKQRSQIPPDPTPSVAALFGETAGEIWQMEHRVVTLMIDILSRHSAS
jgi:hypothetical protein